MHAPKAPAEPIVALGHRYSPPNPLGAVSGPLRAPARPLHSHVPNRASYEIAPCSRLARRPGGCAASHREHTTSADIAVAGVTRKSRSRRAPGGCYGGYGTLPVRLWARFKDAVQVRSDELLARCCWHHLFEWSGSTVGTPRSDRVVLTRQLERILDRYVHSRAPFGVHPSCHDV